MTLSIENKENSGIALLESDGAGFSAKLRPFAFPGQRVDILPGRRTVIRVPEQESDGLVSVSGAREQIPLVEAMGKGFEAYDIESLPVGQGGRVNGRAMNAGEQVEDFGIIFTFA